MKMKTGNMSASNLILIIAGASLAVLFVLSHKQIKQTVEPTLQQWTNRLIEHFEPENIVEAAKRFLGLIDSGVAPAHAFEMVVRM